MAQAGFTPISLYNTATASAVPTSGNLVAGELALNTLDEKLYFKNSGGTVKLLASNAATSATVSSVAMSVPSFLSVAGSPITTSGTLAVTFSGTAIPVANGGTALTAGTSGGVLAYTASGTLASSGVLAQYGVVIGGGAGAVPTSTAVGTATQVLTSNGAGVAPTFQAPAAGGISYTAVKIANYSAVNNDGVLTNTTGGGFTVTFPASPSVGNQIVVVDAFSQWGTNNLIVDPTGSQRIAGGTLGDTLTLDITGATVTFVYTGSSYGWSVFAQVGGNGGTAVTLTGVQTLTNKTIAFGSNTLSDVASLSTVQTFTGTKSLTGTSATLAMVLTDTAEVATVSATVLSATAFVYEITSQSVIYFTNNPTANFTFNFRASTGTTLNAAMTTGQSVTVAALVTNGATAYYNNVVQVDGTTVTPKFQGGTAYAAGNASSIDVYMYTIIKTGNAAFTVFTSQTKFA